MAVIYFKRYRMDIDLRSSGTTHIELPHGYVLWPWSAELLDTHAEVKYRSFRWEVDSDVFPCLGNLEGCRQLMYEISSRNGFLPDATWLAVYDCPEEGVFEYCGTIQGIRNRVGNIRGKT